MNPDQKSRLLIGTLVAAVIIVGGYVLFQEFGRAPQTVVQPIAPVSAPAPTPEPTPGLPRMSIKADGSVTAGTGGHEATITADSDLAYEWTIQGGTIEGITSGSSITWTAGSGSATVLTCKGTNTADKSSIVTVKVPLRQLPTITRFESEPVVITAGSSAKLSWNAKDTQTLVLEPGGQDVSKFNGPALEVKPENTTTYTLKATNSTGITSTRELLLKVVPLPEITAFRAEPVLGSIATFTVIGEFKAGKAQLKNGSEVVLSGDTSPLRIQLANLRESSSLVLTVTNEAGTYVTSTLNFSAKKP
jgi:hypothetical protein